MLATVVRRLPAASAASYAPLRPVAARCLASKAAALGKKPKVDDGTLEGRYATALFMASSNKLDKIYEDLLALRGMMAESKEFKVMVETPGINPQQKMSAIDGVAAKVGSDAAVVNFLKVLVENKRLNKLPKMIEMFEMFYRAEKGIVPCAVTSASELTSGQKGEVKAAMEKRAAKGSNLIMEYNVNPAIMGGLVVKLGEAVYDYSVQSRLDRLTTRLLAPVE
eukprot:TRINITY_DN149_c0_g2_i2.p2 TRINITY_DN149_c0_g2~~TRINITY_DN149_c0_g2_i2.p2  ORF type:complete len:243 (-),score=75.56 TRINITY_DN149_c0_g2_i2:117-785(-)